MFWVLFEYIIVLFEEHQQCWGGGGGSSSPFSSFGFYLFQFDTYVYYIYIQL